MFRISCPFCGSYRIGVLRTTRHIYLPESIHSINKGSVVVEDVWEKENLKSGVDKCSFFCNECLKHIEKEKFNVKKFIINGEEFF